MERTTLLATALSLSTISFAGLAQAQQPSGWIGNGHTSAYTLGAGEFELSGSLLRVDETIDFLDLREEVLANNNRLTGNSGDLDGSRGTLRVGIWRGMELFYSRQQQDLTLKVAPNSRVDIADLDEKLQTTSTSWAASLCFIRQQTRCRSDPGPAPPCR